MNERPPGGNTVLADALVRAAPRDRSRWRPERSSQRRRRPRGAFAQTGGRRDQAAGVASASGAGAGGTVVEV
jgi:hypothetical protein